MADRVCDYAGRTRQTASTDLFYGPISYIGWSFGPPNGIIVFRSPLWSSLIGFGRLNRSALLPAAARVTTPGEAHATP
jgi:hypothetical protein